MRINITGKNVDVTEGIRTNIENALNHMNRYYKDRELEADVMIKTYSHGQKIEITLPIDKNHTLRQEVTDFDLYNAIVIAAEKLEHQLRKVKERLKDEQHKEKRELLQILAEVEENQEETSKIERRKEIELKPMSEEEALLQFELLGHDFYVFEDAQTGESKVLYTRKDNSYGVLVI